MLRSATYPCPDVVTHNLSIIVLVIFAQKKKESVVLYSSFPARESLGLISYVTASQLLGLPPRTHFCYFFLIICYVIFANIIKKDVYRTLFPTVLYVSVSFLEPT